WHRGPRAEYVYEQHGSRRQRRRTERNSRFVRDACRQNLERKRPKRVYTEKRPVFDRLQSVPGLRSRRKIASLGTLLSGLVPSEAESYSQLRAALGFYGCKHRLDECLHERSGVAAVRSVRPGKSV